MQCNVSPFCTKWRKTMLNDSKMARKRHNNTAKTLQYDATPPPKICGLDPYIIAVIFMSSSKHGKMWDLKVNTHSSAQDFMVCFLKK